MASSEQRRFVHRLAAMTVFAGAGITAVGCEAPRQSSAGDLAAPAIEAAPDRVEPEVIDAGHDAPSALAPRAADTADPEDAARLAILEGAPITRVERGSGGRSVAFRLTFSDGSRGYFKPAQTFSGAVHGGERAAYHVDRMLGLRRAPVTAMRAIEWSRLAPLLGADPRAAEVLVGPDGLVRGSVSAWIEEPLVPLVLGVGFERWMRVEEPPYLTPFQRPRVYLAQASGREPITMPVGEDGRALPLAGEPDRADRGAELSDLVLFDHLVHNPDRWGGGFTNVRTRGRGGPLVFLDQGGAFGPGMQEIGFMDRRLAVVQRFRRTTVEAIRTLDVDALAARLEADGLGELLDERRRRGLLARRAAILAHVDAELARHGESATFPW